MSKKAIAVIVILVVVVIIIGVVGFNHRAKAPAVSDVAVATSTAIATQQATSTPTTTPSTTSGSGTVSIVVSTSTTKTYSGISFSFSYPASWNIFSITPLWMTNFNGQYKTGGAIPAGGAQLGVVTTTAGGPVANIMATELMKAIGLATSTDDVSGISCAEATYEANYAAGAVAQNISLYCLRGTELWKIYYSYPAGDPAEKADLSVFDGILSSMKFL